MSPPLPEVEYLAAGRGARASGFYITDGARSPRLISGPFSKQHQAEAALAGVMSSTEPRLLSLRERALACACPIHGAACRLAGSRGLAWTWTCGHFAHADSAEVRAAEQVRQ